METVDEIFKRYSSDKSSDHHNYTRQYESLMKDFRDKPIRYLEIGVFKGESVKAFREVFKNAERIVGIDIDQSCKQYEDLSKNIHIEIGNSINYEFIKSVVAKHGPFDIILDDGSHINRDVIISFELLFPLLADNGLYIVEDTICYKGKGYIDPRFEDHLKYFFKYTYLLNQWRVSDSTSGIRDNAVDPFKIQKKTSNVFEYSIDKIEYGCSYIAIHKKLRKHWI